ncbi:hypothetical protein B0O80DRAFT_454444, partial [Mortierella sp. GBAus27b]
MMTKSLALVVLVQYPCQSALTLGALFASIEGADVVVDSRLKDRCICFSKSWLVLGADFVGATRLHCKLRLAPSTHLTKSRDLVQGPFWA